MLYRTYRTWRYGRELTAYALRIIALHKKRPDATLAELLGRKSKILDLSRKAFMSLTITQRRERNLAFEARRLVRNKGASLSQASREVGLSILKIRRHLGRVIRKAKQRWYVLPSDRIQRKLSIYTDGRHEGIIVTNAEDASLLGRYFNAVKKSLYGDHSDLQKFRGKTITDANGNVHILETDPDKLRKIDERQEHPEFQPLYLDE